MVIDTRDDAMLPVLSKVRVAIEVPLRKVTEVGLNYMIWLPIATLWAG